LAGDGKAAAGELHRARFQVAEFVESIDKIIPNKITGCGNRFSSRYFISPEYYTFAFFDTRTESLQFYAKL